jgi:hypothetical protein
VRGAEIQNVNTQVYNSDSFKGAVGMNEYSKRDVGDERAMQLAIEARQKSKASG